MAIDKIDFLKKLKSLLMYHKMIGIGHYPHSEDVASFCGLQPPAPLPSLEETGGLSPPGTEKAVEIKGASRSKSKTVSLSDIGIEVAACRACELHKQRIHPVAGRGGGAGGGVRLLVVGDWLSEEDDGGPAKERIFGFEQDQMLARMLAAIKIQPGDVFATNVIKCAVPVSCYPAAEHVRCCMSFLRRQIALLAPEVMCTMGMIAVKAVLDRPQSLSQLRGKFHLYEAGDGLQVPVLATYHPTFLLQNPEMKKATWADLQLLAKRLGTASDQVS